MGSCVCPGCQVCRWLGKTSVGLSLYRELKWIYMHKVSVTKQITKRTTIKVFYHIWHKPVSEKTVMGFQVKKIWPMSHWLNIIFFKLCSLLLCNARNTVNSRPSCCTFKPWNFSHYFLLLYEFHKSVYIIIFRAFCRKWQTCCWTCSLFSSFWIPTDFFSGPKI